jgi:hypothetical protein
MHRATSSTSLTLHRLLRHLRFAAALILVTAPTILRAQETTAPARTSGEAPALLDGPVCAVDAVIYDLRIPADQITRLDVDALSRGAANLIDFEKSLASVGTARAMYRTMQTIRLGGDSLKVGGTAPYITGATVGRNGQSINSISYSDIGTLISITGRAGSGGRVELDLHVDLTAMTSSSKTITLDVKAPLFRHVSISRKGTIESGKALVAMTIDASAPDPDGKALAYVAWVKVGPALGTQN